MAFPLEFFFRCFSALHCQCPDSGLASIDETCRDAHALFKRLEDSKEGFMVEE